MDFVKYKNIMDEIITAYETMEDLYKQKQEILVNGKSEELGEVDGRILDNNDLIQTYNNQRLETAGDLNMSQIIEMAKAEGSPLLSDFLEQKVKINKLSESLVLLEQSNVELIKHGLTMADKTLNIIVNAFLPQSNQYDNKGKNVENHEITISSVEEEA